MVTVTPPTPTRALLVLALIMSHEKSNAVETVQTESIMFVFVSEIGDRATYRQLVTITYCPVLRIKARKNVIFCQRLNIGLGQQDQDRPHKAADRPVQPIFLQHLSAQPQFPETNGPLL